MIFLKKKNLFRQSAIFRSHSGSSDHLFWVLKPVPRANINSVSNWPQFHVRDSHHWCWPLHLQLWLNSFHLMSSGQSHGLRWGVRPGACSFLRKKEKETFIVLFTLNLSLGVRLSARSSNVMSWVIWGGVFTGNNMNSIVIVLAKSAKKTDGFSCPHQQNLCSPARGAFLQHCPHAEYVNSVERSLFWHHRVY